MRDLKDIAIRLRIEPARTAGRIVPVKTVIHVLNKITESYTNFLSIEFLKKDDFKKVYDQKPEALKSILSDLQLNVVDLSFNSFEVAIAPNIFDPNVTIFSDDINDWKVGIYYQYKDDILEGDFTHGKYMNAIEEHYSDDERRKIYDPLFKSVGDQRSYKVQLLNADRKHVRTIVKPDNAISGFYTAGAPKPTDKPELKTVQFYAKVEADDPGNPFKKANIKKFLYHETLEHDTYPFKPKTIRADNFIYVLKEDLECNVEYKGRNYIISYPPLDILVKKESRSEAEEAFHLAFHTMYVDYEKEENNNLNKKATDQKTTLLSIIDQTMKV